jgi:hypothetical protein
VLRVPAARLTGYAEAVVQHLVLQVRAYTAANEQPGEVPPNCGWGTHAGSINHR